MISSATAIESAYGLEVQTELLSAAMVASWFRNYWLLRDEFERDPLTQGGVGGIERQPGRLRAVRWRTPAGAAEAQIRGSEARTAQILSRVMRRLVKSVFVDIAPSVAFRSPARYALRAETH